MRLSVFIKALYHFSIFTADTITVVINFKLCILNSDNMYKYSYTDHATQTDSTIKNASR